ncbi:MAG TPA: hypothetical protein VEI01_06185 [Terriglobales bacterium]|nr:hypothetical protein [Terriglobales bacterium]
MITPLDVLLVSRAKVEGLHAGGDLRPNREGLFLKLDGPADGHRSGAGDGSDTKQQVVLPAEPPIDLSGKSGVITEGKIPIEIELVVGTIGSEKTARVRKPPVPLHSPATVIEICTLLGMRRCHNCNQENHIGMKRLDFCLIPLVRFRAGLSHGYGLLSAGGSKKFTNAGSSSSEWQRSIAC